MIVVATQICQTEIESKKKLKTKLCDRYTEQKQIILMGIDMKRREEKKMKESENREKKRGKKSQILDR